MIKILTIIRFIGSWVSSHKSLTGVIALFFILSLGIGSIYLYIQKLHNDISSLEVKLDQSENFINQLTTEIEFQNEAIDEMEQESKKFREQAQKRLEEEKRRQKEFEDEFKPSKTTKELNEWLESL